MQLSCKFMQRKASVNDINTTFQFYFSSSGGLSRLTFSTDFKLCVDALTGAVIIIRVMRSHTLI